MLAIGFATAPAAAEGPAGEREAYRRAEASFVVFAEAWLAAALQAGMRSGDGTPGKMRGPDPRFSIELRATGRRRTPYVGLLHYREHVYQCAGDPSGACEVTHTTPVTEIFRFQNGHWVH